MATKKNLLSPPLLGIEPQFLSHPARSLATIPAVTLFVELHRSDVLATFYTGLYKGFPLSAFCRLLQQLMLSTCSFRFFL